MDITGWLPVEKRASRQRRVESDLSATRLVLAVDRILEAARKVPLFVSETAGGVVGRAKSAGGPNRRKHSTANVYLGNWGGGNGGCRREVR